jgi:hypothetical protein
VIGYTADADIWCPACAEEVYGPLTEDTEDREGNLIYPIFAVGEWKDTPICNSRREALID